MALIVSGERTGMRGLGVALPPVAVYNRGALLLSRPRLRALGLPAGGFSFCPRAAGSTSALNLPTAVCG